MKTLTYGSSVCAAALVALSSLPALSAEIDYFLSPPGCAWGRILFTNSASSCALALERCSEGFVVAGNVKLPGDTYHSALVAILAEDGTVIRSNIFPGFEAPSWGRLGSGAGAVIPSSNSLGQPDGYVVCGYKMKHFVGVPGVDPRPEL